MGATISTSTISSPSLSQKDSLNLLTNALTKLCTTYPAESRIDFKRPLAFPTLLRPANFQNDDLYSTKKNKNVVVQSNELRMDGIPQFTLEQNNDNYIAHVGNFEYLYRVLSTVGENRLTEVQAILSHDKDVMQTILGMQLDTKTHLKVLDALKSDLKSLSESEKRLYRLYLVINAIDVEIMQESVRNIQKEIFLSVEKAEAEIQVLQGLNNDGLLENIEWDTNFVFSNGCKAPPWRHAHGELGYLTITTKDAGALPITLHKKGYFINKGYSKDSNGKETLNYENSEENVMYDTLIDLLRQKSPVFSKGLENVKVHYSVKEALPALPSQPKLKQPGSAKKNNTNAMKTTTVAAETKKQEVKKKSNEKGGKKAIPEKSSKWQALEAVISSSENAHEAPKPQSSPRRGTHSARPRALSSFRRKYEVDESTDSESEALSEFEDSRSQTDLPTEYYQIQKLVRYMRCGNETATVIAICALGDFDLSNDSIQYAIREVGGLETLINLLDTESVKCKIGALRVLIGISQNVHIRNAIAELDGMQSLVDLLRDSEEDVKCLAAEAIAHCAKNSQNRRDVRRYGGIRKLIKLLKSATDSRDSNAAIRGAMALATCSKSAKNKDAILACDAIPIFAELLKSKNEALLIPLVALLQECASDERYRVEMRKAGMIKFLVEGLATKNEMLQTHCASAIFKCAEDEEVCVIVREYNGLAPLVALLDNVSNKELLVAATGAVWKCANNLENVASFNKLNTIRKLVHLLDKQPEEVLINVVGALGACAKIPEGRQAIRENGGIPHLANLLKGTNQNLLINVTTAVGACAHDSESMNIIDRLDGVRLLWSLLKSPNPNVQASAAWAICPCIQQAKDAGEMVRSFVGGLELIISLLKSENNTVLSSICAAIAVIAKDEENLAVISDHGAVPMLSNLTTTKNEKLRKHLAEAITQCCNWGNNRVAFGNYGAVAPLVKYLKSEDINVHVSTAKALHQLSKDPDNCITMHEHGVVQLLLGMVGSSDTILQEAAAGTIGNIRRLALESEKL